MAAVQSPVCKIQIFGHSYVKRLKQFIGESSQFRFNLQLNSPTMVQYSGFPGATVDTLLRNLECISDFEPDYVILLIGTNDIYRQTNTPESVANSVIDMVNTLYASTQVRCVIVMPVFHRQHSSRTSRWPVDPVWFNSRVDKLNILLSSKLTSLPDGRARFWRCNGFWSNSARMRTLSPDGVHLSPRGQERLYFNIRAAVVAVLKSGV